MGTNRKRSTVNGGPKNWLTDKVYENVALFKKQFVVTILKNILRTRREWHSESGTVQAAQ